MQAKKKWINVAQMDKNYEAVKFTQSDVATLSPYITNHIKRFGDYVIDLDNVSKSIELSVSIP